MQLRELGRMLIILIEAEEMRKPNWFDLSAAVVQSYNTLNLGSTHYFTPQAKKLCVRFFGSPFQMGMVSENRSNRVEVMPRNAGVSVGITLVWHQLK
jgi:hypothetical protein